MAEGASNTLVDTGASASAATLTWGAIERRTLEQRAGVRPIFLIGADEPSLRWLRHHGPYLKHRGAIGYVLGVSGTEALERLRTASGIRAIFPATGVADIAHTFNIDRYPVLIDPAEGRIVQ